ncbi:protein FATTY ACID EXPORT 3, chloroplastic isoform X2 [Selaginella moellendorffii]|uniref:protein FATTY ACID EXPORT 3, chloroplastic isoform X2 n=1 Tax=Selaginella moellendorffii TaxID=88036 RepID=UPI000D1CDEDE|nr:protein FATTY ACID EXPORT 3, chloroplastic isoform X2 [Selaginella moellendorffii]|eukprot:XP_024521319.1 protein FATTY ACID EXPORT 3, chloroplastic isoform X2 [Selaginella moellendorffii]
MEALGLRPLPVGLGYARSISRSRSIPLRKLQLRPCFTTFRWSSQFSRFSLDHDSDMASGSGSGDEFDDHSGRIDSVDPSVLTEDQGDFGVTAALLGEEEDEQAVDHSLHRVKDILDAAGNEKHSKGAKLHDFCLGIPYGGVLVASGVASFILTGSAWAIQVGLVLGGLLLMLSVSSLNAWKKGKSSMSYIQGQAAIAFVIFLVQLGKARQRVSLLPMLASLVSGAMLGFFCYVFLAGGNPPPKKVTPVPKLA